MQVKLMGAMLWLAENNHNTILYTYHPKVFEYLWVEEETVGNYEKAVPELQSNGLDMESKHTFQITYIWSDSCSLLHLVFVGQLFIFSINAVSRLGDTKALWGEVNAFEG